MQELTDFYNDGTGWVCRQCDDDLKKEKVSTRKHSRMFNEGEAESKTPELANRALARWMDKIHSVLICPRCKITEAVDKH